MTEHAEGAAASSDGALGASGPPAIELQGIVKRFPGVVANDGIDLAVAPGEIHAIVGENGAGKSTLMKILYGEQRPDEGTITVEASSRASSRRGTRSPSASAWCTSTSCWPTTSRSRRT